VPTSHDEAFFWMGGRLATDLIEISTDPSSLSDGGFWAVSTTFEGGFIAAKFAKVEDKEFPSHNWEPLKQEWTSSLNHSDYVGYVDRIRQSIADGWVYQVNACRILSNSSQISSLRGLFSKILKENPSPWACYLEIPELNIASASPELFLKRVGSDVKTSPIKGTQSSSGGVFGQKDRAENIMIVDLMRNDLGQICENGSVEVTRLLSSEDHPGLQHLVSDIHGTLKNDISWSSIFALLSPAGSISGAPKSSAMQVIKENEEARGPYCGVFGWVQADKAELSVAIRIFWNDRGIHFGTGAGITWSSDPVEEWNETVLKADRLIKIAGGSIK
jgi:para-aminobenzoate synthetase component 1